jgi:hypothetical protein
MAVVPMTCLADGEKEERILLGASIPFDVISDPGAYICNWSGHLLRVRSSALRGARDGALNLVGSEPLLVTKISDNPQIAVGRARAIANQLSLAVNF